MRYFAAIGLSEHRFSIQHVVRTRLVQHTITSALAIFLVGFLNSNPANAKTQICNGGEAEILIAYMLPDGRLGAGDLDYIRVEGWHRLVPGQCEKNEGRIRVAVAQLDGRGNWGFPDYTIDGSWSWQVFNRTRHRSCVAPPGKRFKYGPGPSREPCPTGFVETTFPLEASDPEGLFAATVNIKTTVFPKLLPLEEGPVASKTPPTIQLFKKPVPEATEPDAPGASGTRAIKNSGLFAGAPLAKALEPDAPDASANRARKNLELFAAKPPAKSLESDASDASANLGGKDSGLFRGGPLAKAPEPDPYLTKLKSFITDIIISRTIPLVCPDDYSLVGATAPEDHAKALGIYSYQGLIEASVNAVSVLLDPKKADDPIAKAALSPEITKTATEIIGMAKVVKEKQGCDSFLFVAFAEPAHLFVVKAAKH